MSRRSHTFFSKLANATKKSFACLPVNIPLSLFILDNGQYKQSLFDDMSSKHMLKVEKNTFRPGIFCVEMPTEYTYICNVSVQIVAEARSREMLEDYKGAHRLLKQAVDILISGVQHDNDPARREGL